MRLRPSRVAAACRLLAGSVAAGALLGAAPPESGLWRTQNHASVIAIEVCGTSLCGHIAGVGLDHPTDPRPLDKWGRPQCGETIIRMDHRGVDGRWHGTILDPRSGRNWQAQIWREGDGLRLRGYVGLPVFGATETWTAYSGRLGPDCLYGRD